jgi:hypothetical protein
MSKEAAQAGPCTSQRNQPSSADVEDRAQRL